MVRTFTLLGLLSMILLLLHFRFFERVDVAGDLALDVFVSDFRVLALEFLVFSVLGHFRQCLFHHGDFGLALIRVFSFQRFLLGRLVLHFYFFYFFYLIALRSSNFHNQVLALLDAIWTHVIVAAVFAPVVLVACIDHFAAAVATRGAASIFHGFEHVALITRWRTFGGYVAIVAVVVVAVFVGLSAAVVAVLAQSVCTANITAYCIHAVVRLTLPWLGPALNNVSFAAGLA